MSKITYCDAAGRLLETFSYTSDETMQLNTVGRLFVEGEYNGATHYILNGQIAERPASPVTRYGRVLNNVPNGSIVWCDGQAYPATGNVTLEFPLPGTYALRVECFPYLDWTDEVTV